MEKKLSFYDEQYIEKNICHSGSKYDILYYNYRNKTSQIMRNFINAKKLVTSNYMRSIKIEDHFDVSSYVNSYYNYAFNDFLGYSLSYWIKTYIKFLIKLLYFNEQCTKVININQIRKTNILCEDVINIISEFLV